MAEIQNFIGQVVKTEVVTILNGQTSSPAVQLKGATLKTIILPAAFDGTILTFQVSDDNVTFHDYYNILNAQVSIDVSPNRAYGLAAIDFFSIDYLKIVSNAAETADRAIKLVTRGI
jgi:hypothetical protein